MRGPIRFSDVPYRRRPLDVLLEPFVYVSNLVVASCLYPAWRTSRIQWEPDAAELIRMFKERSRPIMCFAWHAYELNSFCAFRDFPRDLVPMAIGHDGPQSRALQQSAAWYGFPVWVYRRRSPVQPKTQIIDLLKAERPVIGVFVDSGGPDGQVRSGFLEVARAAEITNSVAPDDPCTIPIDEKYKALLGAMGEARWHQLCEEAKKAHNGVNLSTRVRPHRRDDAR